MRKHRSGRTLRRAGIVGVAVSSLIAVGFGAWANDTISPDSDTTTNGLGPLSFSDTAGGSALPCSDLGTNITTGGIVVNYNGAATGTTHHYTAGENLTVTFDTSAVTGVTVWTTPIGTTPTVPTEWNSNTDSFTIPFTINVAPGATAGDVGVTVTGQSSGYSAGQDAGGGKPHISIAIDSSCTSGGTGPSTNTSPTVDAGGPYTGNEGSAISLSGASASDTDSDPLTYSWTYADAAGATNPTGSSCSFDDATALNPNITCNDNGHWTLTLSVSDGVNTAVSDTADLQVSNVAPTIGTISGPTNVLTGVSYTYSVTGTTDPSTNDTSTGFWYNWDGSGYPSTFPTSGSGNTFSTSFSSCGTGNAVTATAEDKDGGESSQATLDTISAYDANFRQPITQGVYNAVPKGYVLPVKVFIGCGTTFNSSLTPRIALYSGDNDPNTDYNDPTQSITTTSASSADSGTTMRLADGQYIYNLQIPATASVGQTYTVVVWPFGSATPYANSNIKAVLKIRK